MSNKTQLQTNNAKLEALITELQGKAAGGGGSEPYVGEFASITDNGMYEPGANEYVFDYSNNDIDLSAVTVLYLFYNKNKDEYAMIFLKNGSGYGVHNAIDHNALGSNGFVINQTTKTITAFGTLTSSLMTLLGFKAYFG